VHQQSFRLFVPPQQSSLNSLCWRNFPAHLANTGNPLSAEGRRCL
jgi:hypothetical protein